MNIAVHISRGRSRVSHKINTVDAYRILSHIAMDVATENSDLAVELRCTSSRRRTEPRVRVSASWAAGAIVRLVPILYRDLRTNPAKCPLRYTYRPNTYKIYKAKMEVANTTPAHLTSERADNTSLAYRMSRRIPAVVI